MNEVVSAVLAELSTPEQMLMFAAGAFFVATLWLAGKKLVAAWYVGLAGNVVWYCVVFVGHNWALLLLVVTMTVVHTRNLIKWRREARAEQEERS